MEFFGIKPNTGENKKIDLSVGNDFFALMDKFIEQCVCSKNRRQHYISLRERLCRFVAYKMLVKKQGAFSLSVHRFTNDLFVEFSQYLEREYEYISVYPRIFEAVPYSKYYKPRPMGANTLSHLQNNLRIFLKWCYAKDFIQNHSFMNFEIRQQRYGTPYNMSIEERDRLYAFEFPDSPFKEKYEMERDTFIFQCLIGCRISDLKAMARANIHGDYLEYIPKKTIGKLPRTVRVPLVQKAKEILARHEGKQHKDGRLFHFYQFYQFSIYEQKLKVIFRMAGIDRMVTVYNALTGQEEQRPLYELASTHLARRTFIGNLYNKVKDPNIIASMSGHCENSQAFKRYRSIGDDIKADAIRHLE